MSANHCPFQEDLNRLLCGTLSDAEYEAFKSHVPDCLSCQSTLENLPAPISTNDLFRTVASPLLDVPKLPPAFEERLLAQPPVVDSAADSGFTEPGLSRIKFPGPPTQRGPLGTLGPYHVEEVLGWGAFGVVFKAYDERASRPVAIKVLKPELTSSQTDRVRFEREAKQASRAKHEHVVEVYAIATTPGFPLPYIVMEFVDGESLSDRLLRKGVFDPTDAARIVQQVALGLAAAASQGLVHRDIKPSNILLDRRSGRAKIGDFGLARPVDLPSQRLTLPGQHVGTPAYMSPEQLNAPDFVDTRSDIYSLGVVLYELLTGERPFRGASHLILHQLLNEDPRPPRRINDQIPVDLETITLRSMVKVPSHRYQAASELADDLGRFVRGDGIIATPVGSPERAWLWAKRKPLLAGLTASLFASLLLGTVFGTWQAIRATSQRNRAVAAEMLASDRLVKVEKANTETRRALDASELARGQARAEAENAKRSADEALAVLEFFQARVLAAARPKNQEGGLGVEATIRDAVDAAEPQIGPAFQDKPLVEASVRNSIGETYQYLGEAELALRQHERARQLRSDLLGPDHLDTLTSINNIAIAYYDLRKLDQAIPRFEQTLEKTKTKLGPDHPRVIEFRNNLAIAYHTIGRPEEALPLFEENLRCCRFDGQSNSLNSTIGGFRIVVV